MRTAGTRKGCWHALGALLVHQGPPADPPVPCPTQVAGRRQTRASTMMNAAPRAAFAPASKRAAAMALPAAPRLVAPHAPSCAGLPRLAPARQQVAHRGAALVAAAASTIDRAPATRQAADSVASTSQPSRNSWEFQDAAQFYAQYEMGEFLGVSWARVATARLARATPARTRGAGRAAARPFPVAARLLCWGRAAQRPRRQGRCSWLTAAPLLLALQEGTYGKVRAATHRETGEQVAVKQLAVSRNGENVMDIIENEVGQGAAAQVLPSHRAWPGLVGGAFRRCRSVLTWQRLPALLAPAWAASPPPHPASCPTRLQVTAWRAVQSCPTVARLHGVYKDKHTVLIVQQLCAGGDLQVGRAGLRPGRSVPRPTALLAQERGGTAGGGGRCEQLAGMQLCRACCSLCCWRRAPPRLLPPFLAPCRACWTARDP
jgi:hypothetical protein